ncbi:hypothetical protein NBT05_00385 [Aquimarina sp. ERC-38]|uniref:hypothetical protein n=1 Tax=Aquimarina sp. ERC-38 TaxID=2949996 RepID=UPI002246FE1F|nr:hypothetical protein [Aquimarina sp. ERC-38]UZO80956.1 hypothetical protein NBT05_00385 [Aquimarina sp. ERC-38]
MRIKDGGVGLGYNLISINAINTHKEITPVFSKAYSYQMGTFSSNNKIKKAIRDVADKLDGKGCWVIDRGGDNSILKGFLTTGVPSFILRLKRNTQLHYKGEALKVRQIVKRVNFIIEQRVVKIKKTKHRYKPIHWQL